MAARTAPHRADRVVATRTSRTGSPGGRGSGERGPRQRGLGAALVVFAVVPIVAAAIGVVRATRPADDLARTRQGSRPIAGHRPLPFSATPEAFDITYRVEQPGDPATVTTERLTALRPFSTRFEARAGTPPGGRVTGERASRLGVLVLSTGAGPRALASSPSLGASDLRWEPVVASSQSAGILERREQREVLGRRCQVWRTGATTTTGRLVPVAQGKGEYSDTCVDAHGLVLEEVWAKNGTRLRRRIAVRVDEHPAVDATRFTLPGEHPLAFEDGNGFVRPVAPDSALEGRTFRLPGAPAGFEYKGRFAVTPPRLDAFGSPQDDSGSQRASIGTADVWQRGADVLVLEQTIVAGSTAAPEPDPNGIDVDLGPLGTGQAILDLRGNEVRADLEGARSVRLVGTLPLDDLIALGRSLTEEQGTGVRFLD